MKVHHDAARDYVTIDFTDEVEARAIYEDGIIVRYDKSGGVIGIGIGIDIVDSMKLFTSSDLWTLQDVCRYLNVSESTIRRRIKSKQIRYTKEGNRYRFKRADVVKLGSARGESVAESFDDR